MSEKKTRTRIKRKAAIEVGTGTVELLSSSGRVGVITQLDGSGEVYFNFKDVETKIAPEQLRGRVVQFVKEESETGLRAKQITVLGSEESA